MYMLILLLVLQLIAQNSIFEALNKPVSWKSLDGYEEFLNYNSAKETLKFTRNKSRLRPTTNVIINMIGECYNIRIQDKYLYVDLNNNLRLIDKEEFASAFDIIPTENGLKIKYDDQCMTKNSNRYLLVRKCLEEKEENIKRQRFIFLTHRNSFFGNFDDLFCNQISDLSDDVSLSDIDLEKKFNESVYDKPFVESMKYFYDFAVQESKNKNIFSTCEEQTKKILTSCNATNKTQK